jgi:flagellar basal-body rod protein FlgC
MISSISSTLSALSAYGKRAGVTADNVANWQSEEFKKSQAIFTEGENKTVDVEVRRIDTPGPIVDEVKDGEVVQKVLSNVELAEEIPQTMVTQRGYEANLNTIAVQDETLKSIIDIVG